MHHPLCCSCRLLKVELRRFDTLEEIFPLKVREVDGLLLGVVTVADGDASFVDSYGDTGGDNTTRVGVAGSAKLKFLFHKTLQRVFLLRGSDLRVH